jgi:energy-coupling factor transporter ATP-binding protein EcfA2
VDFYTISVQFSERKEGPAKLIPDWTVGRSKDLMVRGGSFYAVWDEAKGFWSTDEYDVQRLVDEDLHRYNKEHGGGYVVQDLRSFNTKTWRTFRSYMQHISDNSHQLDEKLVFANTEVKKTDYASRRLPYSLEPGSYEAWDELLGVLYSEEERAKIEWAIGAVVSGDSKTIQKFLVFYGPAGSGKSTVLSIIQKLFQGYATTFDAKALGSANNSFATEVFKANPLVAIQHDGDLSKIDDNTRLNSIISHEEMTMNEKFKASYTSRVNAFLFMGTNQPVKISDAKSGIIRRLIDVHPTGATIESKRYQTLLKQIDFELGAIAQHCLDVYKRMGKNYYNSYRPVEMMLQTDVFYNFVESIFDILKAQDGISLKQAYELYKEYCGETGIDRLMPQYKFRSEFRNYFEHFQEQAVVDGVRVRSYYTGFKHLAPPTLFIPDDSYRLELIEAESVLDGALSESPAQYARSTGFPGRKWEKVTTTLSDLDTKRLHYVKVPKQHIVIDFDLVDENGDKDLERNIEEASKWPATYAELSKSGAGIHLHYIYTGNVHELANVYDVGIEVKTLLGNQSLRRILTLCNTLAIATLSSGLPIKETPMLDTKTIQSEKGLRELIERNLRKEIHPGTKPSIDFIHKILEEAYASDIPYNLLDLRPRILAFAANSSNQSATAIKVVQTMRFASDDAMQPVEESKGKPIVFFDVEVYPNLFVVCWKYAGDTDIVRMVNPTAAEIEPLFAMRLVGFNNRRYDNHILYAAFLGYSNERLYELSQKIIDNDHKALFGEAYNLSYADIFDFSSKKQSLKKFQIELGIFHLELDLPWDQPVSEEMWDKVAEYCCNDVESTEAVFNARKDDFVAREILAELSGLPVNQTTQNHTARIIFGEDRNPQRSFVYTDLSEMFPGYEFDGKQSTYRGEVTGEGGYVYAEEGMYENVALLDVASMHPASIELLNLFGPYTEKFAELKEARLAIKHKDYEKARKLLNGQIAKFLDDDSAADSLSYALKIVINIVYGLTSAKFDNLFRDNRNRDNIVAKRGALFMIDLKHAVQEQGFTVAHIKTDSIKIPDATPEIIQFVFDFGKKYGYDFEHEATYDQLCLVNEAVYIARSGDRWTAVGAQFQHQYVYKKLFTHEPLEFDDFCETRSVVQGAMYLDFNEDSSVRKVTEFQHVGRTGSFVPVLTGGAVLWRIKDGKRFAVTGTKGYRWIERDTAMARNAEDQLEIDMSYFDKLATDAENAIEYFGSFDRFTK